jgi:short-subunit dehydrogenase
VLLLSHALLPRLARSQDRPAGILNVSSLASALPLPGMALYAASKSFVTSLSESMAVELAPENVVVTCVCPGPTPTQFSTTARRPDGTDTDREGQGVLRIPPQQVVREALAALRKGRACVFPGRAVNIAGSLFRIMPRPLMRWILRRRYAKSS